MTEIVMSVAHSENCQMHVIEDGVGVSVIGKLIPLNSEPEINGSTASILNLINTEQYVIKNGVGNVILAELMMIRLTELEIRQAVLQRLL